MSAKTTPWKFAIFVFTFILAWGTFSEEMFAESFANFKGAVCRSYESVSDLFLKNKVTCNYCGWKGSRFRTFVSSTKIRHNAVCPRCLSLERHREFLYAFNKTETLFEKKPLRILEIAPTKAFQDYCLCRKDISYLSIDLVSKLAMRHMDLQKLELEDNSFDIVVCFHVLDYLPDDSKGMKEILRVLDENGIAITQESIDYKSPVTISYEKPIAKNLYRLRQYGCDFYGKWGKSGFGFILLKSNLTSAITLLSSRPGNTRLEKLEGIMKSDHSTSVISVQEINNSVK